MDASSSKTGLSSQATEPDVSALRASIPSALTMLRRPFEHHHISKLPKESRAQIDARKGNSSVMVFNCPVCGGHHHKDAVHLDYVGHAALTDRLLDTDITWSWEPLAFTQEGLPALDRNGGLWIKLTVCGVTRLGYGAADGKQGGDAVKEIIGDALRNAAMRFGAALDLWHKGDLHVDKGGEGQSSESAVSPHHPANDTKPKRQKLEGPLTSKTALWNAVRAFVHELHGCGDLNMFEAFLGTDESKALLAQCERDAPQLLDGGEGLPEDYEPINLLIGRMRADFELIENNTLRAG